MSWIYREGVQVHLTQAEMENNALEFYDTFMLYGCTLESICGMLGNIQQESEINPADKHDNQGTACGLIQWNPESVIRNWCADYGYDWYDGDAQCIRIKAEGEGTMGASGYWLPTTAYPYSWSEFCNLTNVDEATCAYFYERERAGDSSLETRKQYANNWYRFFGGTPVILGRRLPLIYMAHRIY